MKKLIYILFAIIIIILIGAGCGEKTEISSSKENNEKVEKSEFGEEADFEVTAEEIYSTYIRCKEDSSVEDLVRQKYDGKIVEVTGIVDSAKDYFSRSSVMQGVSDGTAEKILEIREKTIEKNKRCVICLFDNEGHGCVAWIYSSSPRLIEGRKKGDKITVTGQWQYVGSTCGIPDLMNSEIKKIY